MPPSRRTGRLCPWCWPLSWRAFRKPSLPTGPFIWFLHPKVRRFIVKTIQFGILGFLIIILVLWMGMAYEQAQVRKLPNTESFYTTPNVCALTYNSTSVVAKTFPNVSRVEKVIAREQRAHHYSNNNNKTTLIAHCGDCGKCSTPHDVIIYDETRNTLFEESIACAKHGMVGGYRGASRCMTDRVGLSRGCNECWVENIMCDLRKCIFTCFLKAIFSKGVHGGSSTQELNRCTLCDEVRCGPAFLKCAGANRRRTAIKSDIERDDKVEVCANVQSKWWLDQELQTVWQHENVDDLNNATTRRKKRLFKRIRAKREGKREEKFNGTRL